MIGEVIKLCYIVIGGVSNNVAGYRYKDELIKNDSGKGATEEATWAVPRFHQKT